MKQLVTQIHFSRTDGRHNSIQSSGSTTLVPLRSLRLLKSTGSIVMAIFTTAEADFIEVDLVQEFILEAVHKQRTCRRHFVN